MSAGDQRGVAMLAVTRLAGLVLELGAPHEVVVETTISGRTQRNVFANWRRCGAVRPGRQSFSASELRTVYDRQA